MGGYNATMTQEGSCVRDWAFRESDGVGMVNLLSGMRGLIWCVGWCEYIRDSCFIAPVLSSLDVSLNSVGGISF